MKKKFGKAIRFLKDLTVHFSRDVSTYFYKAWQARLVGSYATSFARSLIFYLNQFRIYLYINGIQQHHTEEDKIHRLHKISRGLHQLLPADTRFSFSILIPVTHPNLSFFKQCLKSILDQSAPNVEILIGHMFPPSKSMEIVLMQFSKNSPNCIKEHYFFQEKNENAVINQLAEKASGNFLFIMGEEDWIRPDLLLRYEQTLRIFSDPEKTVLYCNINSLNDQNYFIPQSEYRQPSHLIPPFVFKSFREQGLLIPTNLWKKAGGLQSEYQGAEFEHLLLQLEFVGAHFQHIPINFYALRASSKVKRTKSPQAFLKAARDYSLIKGLNWNYQAGLQENTLRAIPPLPKDTVIQVIIPYKDQKELTVKCMHSLLRQKDVNFVVTAVDNQSQDKSIAQEIQRMGGEVLTIQEPFNYSRLNNFAVQRTQKAAHCDTLLFLNNDVELEEGALNEMLRWIHQPQIGMVGCRLHYPDGRLQHGGVEINLQGREEMRWEHVEKMRNFEEMDRSKTLGIFEAVTAACAMVKKQTFLDVGGFDEIWYPIGYSDTHLAVKIAATGLKCFYTPYAVGIHHESVSRKSAIEDYENSWWLHHLLKQHGKLEKSAWCGQK